MNKRQLVLRALAVTILSGSFLLSASAWGNRASAAAQGKKNQEDAQDKKNQEDKDKEKNKEKGKKEERLATRSSPIAITHDDRFVWSVNPDNDSVSVFSVMGDDNTKVAEIPVEKEPWCVAITPDDEKAY